ncbi:MAG: hypothetical protein M1829_002125 [Trizodia sp. TS-e1964]|nr:MAG: hypothetical protein M1829_002125 [Trizodia sp. TS-e1964]
MEFHTLVERARNVNCNLDTCSLKQSYFNYRPNLAINSIFLALFLLSFVTYVLQGVLSRRALVFCFAMTCGCILEILGYIGRIMAYHNPFQQPGFLMQICCLTIGPAFFAGGIYLLLRQIVIVFGPENSLIAPESYTRIFIPCDLISLILQAVGGAMASIESGDGTGDTSLGSHIMVAGLSFQVFTLLCFILLCSIFAVRTVSRMRAMGDAALEPRHAALRASWKFRLFLVAIALATVCIFVRSIYRVIELAEGWRGELIKNEDLFIGLEGVMVIVAALLLNVFHPAYMFAGAYDKRETIWGRLRADSGSESEEKS